MNSLVHKTLAYTAYGMPIHSQLALPELGAPMALRTNSVPLRIVNATVDVPDDKVTPHGGYFFDETGSTFWWDQVGKFHVSTDGTIVRVERADGVSDELLAFSPRQVAALAFGGKVINLLSVVGTGLLARCMQRLP